MDISIRYIELELTLKSAIQTGCTFFVAFLSILVLSNQGARGEQPGTEMVRRWYGDGAEKTLTQFDKQIFQFDKLSSC